MYIIGLAGGSGSGKSTFSAKIKEAFPDLVTIISSDNYYKSHDDISLEDRQKFNYDIPTAIEFSLLVEHINALKDGKSIESPVYDFGRHTRSQDTVIIHPCPIIIIDGILIYTDVILRNLIDLKIYVDTDSDERILRRARRDIQERGRSIDSVITQYLQTVKPMHYLYVEPTKSHADIIINGGYNENALDLVLTKIKDVTFDTQKI